MEIIAIILKYGLILALAAAVLYAVVKKAVKDALNECKEAGPMHEQNSKESRETPF